MKKTRQAAPKTQNKAAPSTPESNPRKCRECQSPVPALANVCPTCRSFLDWRRHTTVGQVTLALVVALLSIATTLVSVGIPLLQPLTTNIQAFVVSSRYDAIAILFRNDGSRGGAASVDHIAFYPTKLNERGRQFRFFFNDGAVYVPSGGEIVQTLEVDLDQFDSLFHAYLDDNELLKRGPALTSFGVDGAPNEWADRLTRIWDEMENDFRCEISLIVRGATSARDNVLVKADCNELAPIRNGLIRASLKPL